MLKEGIISFEVVLLQVLEVLGILKVGGGGTQKVYTLTKRGGGRGRGTICILMEGMQTFFGHAIFPLCSLPLPVINDRSLRRP